MIGIKCAACGKSFEVADDQSGKNARCPDCGAIVFVPTVGATVETPESRAPTEKVEKPKHFLSPLEMVLILVILGIMIAFVVYRGVIEKPAPVQPADNAEAVRERIERERRSETDCLDNMAKIGKALTEYHGERGTYPPDLSTLKESGHLDGGVPLFCSKCKYSYFLREAVASEGVVEDPVLVADSEPVHRKGRNVIRTSGKVEFLNDKDFRDTIAAQQAEFEKLEAAKDEVTRKKEKRERQAAELMITAATAFQAGRPEEALEVYKKLLDEYADTEVIAEKSDEIKAKIGAINFTAALENARVFVRQLRLDEAKTAYAQLAGNVTVEQKESIDAELDSIKLIENGRSLRILGDLSGALDQYKQLGTTSADPFWKRMAHELSREIEDYRKEAAALFNSAQKALKAGKKVRALSLFKSLADNFAHSAQAPKALPIITELLSEVPYRERFLPKDKFLDSDAINAIEDGLAWLELNQQPDGSWKSTSTGKNALDNIALTGLSILCFLAEGNTHLSGQYRGTVAAGLNKLKAAQKENGFIGDPASPTKHMSHAFALLALCELRNMTDDDELTPVCQKAVRFAISIQEPGTGWRLADKKQPSDVMLTTWMQLGMLSARAGKLKFLSGLLEGALNTYNAASDAQGRVNYAKPADPSRPRRNLPGYQAALIATASAAYGRLLSGDDPDTSKLKGAVEFLRENLPNGARTNFPYFFFGTRALWQAGELPYLEWKWALKSATDSIQLREGADAGAWDMGRFSDFRGGKVYPTALAILSLQTPYYHFAGIDLRARIEEAAPKGPEVTVVLLDGSRLTGRLVSETDEKIIIEIVKGTTRAEMPFSKKDVKEIIRKQ